MAPPLNLTLILAAAVAPLLLLCANAMPQYMPQLDQVSVRDASPSDIRAIWDFVEASNETHRCPDRIQHTTWSLLGNGAFGLPHNTILHNDGPRCNSNGDEKQFVFYSSTTIGPNFENITPDSLVPDGLVRILNSTGLNIEARFLNNRLGEKYLVGYEARSRFCDGVSAFPNGTTAFLMRPFSSSITFSRLTTRVTIGKKWLLMIPAFQGVECLYNSDINGDDDAPRPSPSDTNGVDDGPRPSQSDEPNETLTESADPELDIEQSPSTSAMDSSPEAEEGGADDDDNVCFPAHATVRLENGNIVPMHALSIGDKVEVADGVFSPIFMFTHNSRHVRHSFVTFTTASGNNLSVTHGHFLYVNGLLATAESIVVGDFVQLSSGLQTKVVTLGVTKSSGLYNPQTLHGDIIVEGIRASTYTTAITPTLAHSLLSPLRALFRMASIDPSFGILASGASI